MTELADGKRVQALIDRLAELIGSAMDGDTAGGQWALVGIRSRGDTIARRVAERLGQRVEGRVEGRVGSLDIAVYRDDLASGAQPRVRGTEIGFGIDAVNVVLVDDVLMTGRSARAAMQGLIDLGRPRRVWLAAMVDRGGRELPICPDFVGLKVDENDAIAPEHRVRVLVEPADERDAIVVEEAER